MKTAQNKNNTKDIASETLFSNWFFDQVDTDDLDNMTKSHRDMITQSHLKMMPRTAGVPAISFSVPDTRTKTWADRKTYLDIIADDMAFMIDSVAALLSDEHYLIDLLLHPRTLVSKNQKGQYVLDKDGDVRQSHLHIVIRGVLNKAQQQNLEQDIRTVIRDVSYATRDWQAMRVRALESKQHIMKAPEGRYTRDEITEYTEFLDYLYDNNFTFLGCRSYTFKVKGDKIISDVIKGSGLGLLSDDLFPAYISDTGEPLPQKLQHLRMQLPALHIGKVNRNSTVHRRVPLDAITVHHYDAKGNVIGETLFVGLFTSVTYSRSLRSIPLLKYKSDTVMRRSGFESASHDGRALRHILEKYPRDELFQISVDELYKTCLSILRLQERQRIALYCRKDLFGRYVSCLVYVPRDRFETRLRLRFQHILEQELNGTCTNFSSSVDDSPLVRVLFTIAIRQTDQYSFNTLQIEEKLQQAGRGWDDTLADQLHQNIQDDEQADRLIARYADAFSADYRERYTLDQTQQDIEKIEQCLREQDLQVDLQKGMGTDTFSLKIYTAGSFLDLSDVLPILENMGLRGIAEHPFVVEPAGEETPVSIHDFTLSGTTAISFDLLKSVFEPAVIGLIKGVYENDTLNGLTFRAGLPARQVMMVRAYIRYLRQTTLPYSLPYMEQAVISYPDIAADLVRYFMIKFDPELKSRKITDLEKRIEERLEDVASLDQDRILRGLYMVFQASVRTNYFQVQKDQTPKEYLSFKIESQKVPFLPDPKPYREIFVYSPRVEGVHLRSHRISRGGLRWSDRVEDFRSEVLSLVKAQIVKNSVVVASGAKGGFIVKRSALLSDRAAYMAEGVECYRLFIRGLLDITDNLLPGNKIVRPPFVIAHDDDDPYLVVAADKGTATFSDYGNALSLEYGFWMGDAFASGGSAGYDHKAMGITARGAWESVKRHFRELGHDTQSQPFDVMGVGDMGGDVFGNGMLLSPFIRLVGAFNHIHIFCDPDPDPKISFKERERLFKGVMGWDQYNPKLLSAGGRIYSRKDKTLELTPEIQKRFDLQKSKVTPFELMNAMLKARVDLLYFGGIGTYIKATHETHMDAKDRSNDSIRVNAPEVRARVVGEGANLGVTQSARIEYARKGGRINADFVDNSGGVDTSDHEVNIKILTSQLIAKKPPKLTLKTRDTLLRSMTNDIAAHVVADNFAQTQIISVQESRAFDLLPEHQQFMHDMEHLKLLDRALEFLPDDHALSLLRQTQKGLTRPEIGVLLSYAKIYLRQELVLTKAIGDVLAVPYLMNYFPKQMQTKFASDITLHPLRNEILATIFANKMVNYMGPALAMQLAKICQKDLGVLVTTFIAVCSLLDFDRHWVAAEKDIKDPKAQLDALYELSLVLYRTMSWLGTRVVSGMTADQIIKKWGGAITSLNKLLDTEKGLKSVLSAAQFALFQEKKSLWLQAGLSSDSAIYLGARAKRSLIPSVIEVSETAKVPLDRAAGVFYRLGDVFAFTTLRFIVDQIPRTDIWAQDALSALFDQLNTAQEQLAEAFLRVMPKKTTDIQEWIDSQVQEDHDLIVQLEDIKRRASGDTNMILVILQRIQSVTARIRSSKSK